MLEKRKINEKEAEVGPFFKNESKSPLLSKVGRIIHTDLGRGDRSIGVVL